VQLRAVGAGRDPERTARVCEWLAGHRDYEFVRDHRHPVWWLSDGRRGLTGSTLSELSCPVDAFLAGEPLPAAPKRYGPPPRPSRRCAHRPVPPDSIA
jgi:hypothetical protein